MVDFQTFPVELQLGISFKQDTEVKSIQYGGGYTEYYLETPNESKRKITGVKLDLTQEQYFNVVLPFLQAQRGKPFYILNNRKIGDKWIKERLLVLETGSRTYKPTDGILCQVTIANLEEVDEIIW